MQANRDEVVTLQQAGVNFRHYYCDGLTEGQDEEEGGSKVPGACSAFFLLFFRRQQGPFVV